MNYKHVAYIGVGSNVGDKADNCRKGISAVGACEGCLMEAQSPLYETEPVEFESQEWFINGAVRVRTCLEPEALLVQLQAIERAMGRGVGARILDLDMLFFDDRILRTGKLQLPHPRSHQRRFVLKPLCHIAPELVHPVLGQTIQSLLFDLKDGEKKVILYE
ncbi:MAG: 2-amino-4-hydroxy-6-hydroxymethyldihydropteridine diphosphokinase [Desulfobacterales bacterium]|nr:2-amino-4-hydroxy-6-hydroxymethyldihydropteridine diphosphokinase [Desulfobacterales bacterium]